MALPGSAPLPRNVRRRNMIGFILAKQERWRIRSLTGPFHPFPERGKTQQVYRHLNDQGSAPDAGSIM
jgi:hypothetical protein